jgi:hypothetical protein
MGRAGAVRVAIITVVTALLSIFAGIVADVAIGISQIAKITPIEALTSPQFGTVFNFYITDPESQGSLVGSVLMSLAFAALGCFWVLRGAFRATATPTAAQQAWPAQPTQPPVDEHPAS